MMDYNTVLLPVPEALVAKMDAAVEEGRFSSADELAEAALAGDPSSWRRPIRPIPHNHDDREVRPKGMCAACDVIIRTRGPLAAEVTPQQRSPNVRCMCCVPGPCRDQLTWRGRQRCACSPQLAGLNRRY